GVVHRAPVGAPAEAVAGRDAVEKHGERAIGVDAHERRRRGIGLLLHRADEEAPLQVAAAIVEAMCRRIVGRGGNALLHAAVAIGEPHAVAQRDDEAAAAAQREGADRRGHRHRRNGPARRVEPMERRCVDVDEVQHLLVDAPHRGFTERRAAIERARERRVGILHVWVGGIHARARAARVARTLIRIVQEKAAPGGSTRMPVPVAPAAARLNASVSCVTGSTATKSRPAGAYTTTYRHALSAVSLMARPRCGRARFASPCQPVNTLSSGTSPTGFAAEKSHSRGTATRSSGSCVASLRHTPSAAKASVVAPSRGKYGCQPRPNGNGASSSLRIVIVTASVAPPSRATSPQHWVAENRHGHARAASPSASWRSASVAACGSRRVTCHARCQPTPWIACGWSPKLRASAYVRPANASRASRMRL